MKSVKMLTVGAVAAVLASCSGTPAAPGGAMTFFVTSVNPGKGGNLGGLAGADRYCQDLASAANAGNKPWRAYLSAPGAAGIAGVNARDRIGNGPWVNAKGVVVARNLEELHGENNLNKQTALTEKGEVISGRGDAVNLHDIMTGSDAQGRLAVPQQAGADVTCGSWTSGDQGSAIVGHHDRIGLNDSAPMKSWNASHGSRGCSLEALKTTGGGGLYYCFAPTAK